MPDVLHLQTRAYPLHFTFPPEYGLDSPDITVTVPRRGTVTITPGTLSTLVYNSDTTAEVDLTGVIAPAVKAAGTTISGCRARILRAGIVLVTYALRHETDLLSLSTGQLVTFDAHVNDRLRTADRQTLLDVLTGIVTAFGTVRQATIDDGTEAASGRTLPVDRRTVRYNCHSSTTSTRPTLDKHHPYNADSVRKISTWVEWLAGIQINLICAA